MKLIAISLILAGPFWIGLYLLGGWLLVGAFAGVALGVILAGLYAVARADRISQARIHERLERLQADVARD